MGSIKRTANVERLPFRPRKHFFKQGFGWLLAINIVLIQFKMVLDAFQHSDAFFALGQFGGVARPFICSNDVIDIEYISPCDMHAILHFFRDHPVRAADQVNSQIAETANSDDEFPTFQRLENSLPGRWRHYHFNVVRKDRSVLFSPFRHISGRSGDMHPRCAAANHIPAIRTRPGIHICEKFGYSIYSVN
ncbi:hypothetical protein HCH_06443 [Hahella chejuensis KCTC 2396]|uniref:Uncharacterized protein n=1 Tax=Hahella chejuensis (strain KCTC 2396) TaxID=349521 RepID=Q2S8D7_HAHCH|nr:hypothetical protein HCH_06443 [Hahella chejuensis KCTC 2396]